MSTVPPNIPPPIPTPTAPGANGADDKISTGEFAALHVEAQKEDKERTRTKPATHWDLVKTQVAVVAGVLGIVTFLVTQRDSIVSKAESKTRELVEEHVKAEKESHAGLKKEMSGLAEHQVAFETRYADDQRALYQAIIYRRPQPRFEREVEEPGPAERRALGIDGGH